MKIKAAYKCFLCRCCYCCQRPENLLIFSAMQRVVNLNSGNRQSVDH